MCFLLLSSIFLLCCMEKKFLVHTTVCLMQGVVRFELCAGVMRRSCAHRAPQELCAVSCAGLMCCGSVPRLVRMGCGVRCPGFFCAGGGSEEVHAGCEVRSPGFYCVCRGFYV